MATRWTCHSPLEHYWSSWCRLNLATLGHFACCFQYIFRKPTILGHFWYTLTGLRYHGPLAIYVHLRVGYVPGMPRTFSPPPQVSDPGMHHGTYLMHVPWCLPGSLTNFFFSSRWRENVPGIPDACATRNFTYLVRGQWWLQMFIMPTWLWEHLQWWRHQIETFSALRDLCGGIHRSPVNSPYKGQWRRLWCFPRFAPEQMAEQTIEPSGSPWRHYNAVHFNHFVQQLHLITTIQQLLFDREWASGTGVFNYETYS